MFDMLQLVDVELLKRFWNYYQSHDKLKHVGHLFLHFASQGQHVSFGVGKEGHP